MTLPPLPNEPDSRVAHTLYSAALYGAASVALPIAAVGALLRPRWRFGWSQRWGHYDHDLDRPVWVHAASIGEVRAAWPLLVALRDRFSDVPILLTTTTMEGHQVATQLDATDAVALFPVDLPHTIARAWRHVRPRAVVVLETELWPNFLRHARRAGTGALLVNGRISDRSFPRYRRFKSFFRRVLDDVRFAGMQSELDLERILALGASPERAGVMGNLKFDALRLPPPTPPQELADAIGSAPVLVAGSVHPGELEVLVQALKRVHAQRADARIVIAPRHLKRVADVTDALDRHQLRWTLRSQLGDAPVIVLDTAGELAGTYGLARAAFIGGSLIDHGGQNPLEALWHGVPVVHGPSMENFREISDVMAAHGVASTASLPQELATILMDAMDDPDNQTRARRTLTTLADERGAVSEVLDTLAPLVKAAA